MNYSKDKSIIINGGPFIVATNQYGAITKNYGWASIKIENLDRYTIISILCNDRTENISDLLVHRFSINGKVTSDLYEDIIIMLQLGYNTMFSYNFSKLDSFKRACEDYFKNLDYNLSDKIG